MKRILYFTSALLLFASCFRDKGNYDYLEIAPPRWISEQPETYYTYAGEKAVLDGSKLFTWPKDSLARANSVRYEWVINGEVVSTDLKFEMPTEELVKRAKIRSYNLSRAEFGVFKIIEKGSEISFQRKFILWTFPYYSSYDWAILSDRNGQANVSTLRERTRGGETKFYLTEKAFEAHNDQKQMVGKPLEMTWSEARHFGPCGAYTILTDQGSYIISADDFKWVNTLDEEFLDGTPPNFKPISRADIDILGADGRPVTFLLNQDGKVYTRVMGANYLGGRFLTEPYELDDKGYELSLFGSRRVGSNFLCHDTKNNRILYASQFIERISAGNGTMDQIPAYRTRLSTLSDTGALALSGLGDNIEVVALRTTSHYQAAYYRFVLRTLESMFTIFYNKKDDPTYTYTADIAVNNQNMMVRDLPYKSGIVLPRITQDDIILTTGTIRTDRKSNNARMRTFITRSKDNSIWYYTHSLNWMSSQVEWAKFNVEIPSKITAMAYEYSDCGSLMIGCENGDIYFYDITIVSQPVLLYKGNVGGKVMTFRSIGFRTMSHDS